MSETDRWLKAGRQALVSGALASLLSSAVLVTHAQRRLRRPAAMTNATSHWLWGDEEAFHAMTPSVRHTGVGYATHHASATMWALFYERWLDSRDNPSAADILVGAAGMSAVAAFVDYRLTPKRLTPGFEAHLTKPGLLSVFAALAVGFAAGGFLNRQHERRLERLMHMP